MAWGHRQHESQGQSWQQVRQEVPLGQAPSARSPVDGRQHEGPLPQGQQFAPDDAGHGHPVGQGHREHDGQCRSYHRSEQYHHQDAEEKVVLRVEHINAPHYQPIDLARQGPRQQTQGTAYGHGYQGRQSADGEGDPQAVQGMGQQVPAQQVGNP